MKLELKHLASYLPYGIEVLFEYTSSFKNQQNYFKTETLSHLNISIVGKKRYGLASSKLLLRPLSQLTEEIEHNGVKFVPMIELKKLFNNKIFIYKTKNINKPIEIDIETENYSQSIDLFDGYLVTQKLFEWQFDVFGLLKNNLAKPKT